MTPAEVKRVWRVLRVQRVQRKTDPWSILDPGKSKTDPGCWILVKSKE